MGVDKYQDLECWRLANDLKLEVYALVNNSSARHDLKFCEQIVDSARSGPRNIAEGFGRYEHPEFARFLCFARGSILETHNHVGDGCDSGYWSASDRIDHRPHRLPEAYAGAVAQPIATAEQKGSTLRKPRPLAPGTRTGTRH